MKIELRHCHHAVVLAQHRNFDRAARAIGISQPSLSRSIQELERRLGAKLFIRSRDGIEPTDVGRLFLERSQAVLVQAADLEHEMELVRGHEVGELRIGAGVYPSEIFIADAVARMAREQPRVKVTVICNITETLLSMLRKRELDIMIADAKACEPTGDLEIETLAWHQVQFVVRKGHPLQNAQQLTLPQLLSYPIVVTTRTPPDVLAALHKERGTSFDSTRPFPAICCDSIAMFKLIVARSDSICYLPANVLSAELAAGRLVVLPFDTSQFGRAFSVIRIADRTPTAAAEVFMQYVREADATAAAINTPAQRRSSVSTCRKSSH